MKEKALLFKIIETLLQVMIIPCCIYGDWADKYYGSYGIEFSKLNFLDASELFDQDYLATILVVLFALTVIIMMWTKARKFAFIPAALQLAIILMTLINYLKLSAVDEGHMLTFGYIHSGMVIAAFVVCVITAIVCRKKA